MNSLLLYLSAHCVLFLFILLLFIYLLLRRSCLNPIRRLAMLWATVASRISSLSVVARQTIWVSRERSRWRCLKYVAPRLPARQLPAPVHPIPTFQVSPIIATVPYIGAMQSPIIIRRGP